MYAPPVQRLITELGKLPGIGQRTAQRLAFHILRADADDANALVVAFDESEGFKRRMLDTPERRAVVESALRGLAGRQIRVQYELRELEQSPEVQPPSEDELVARFKTEFDAEEIVPDDPQPDEPGGQN